MKNFSEAASPTSVSLSASAIATAAVTLTMAGGLNTTVTFGTTGLPPGATALFARMNSAANVTSTVTNSTTGAVAAGAYNFNVTGTNGSLVQSIPVTHPVESCGFVISDGEHAVAMSGDTGPTVKLWQVLNKTKNLRAVLLETSFPNRLQQLADISGHLTPKTLETELAKFDRNGCEVLLYHLKPAFVSQLKHEVKHLPVHVLELGDTFDL